MANVLIEETSMTAIANAIRSKNRTQTTYKPAQMASAILNIPTGGSGLAYDTGTFTLDADVKNKKDIPHNLGAVPKIVVVWTEDFTVDNPNADAMNGGYFMCNALFNDLPTRITSSINADWNIATFYTINATNNVTGFIPTSASYYDETYLPTSEYFHLPITGSANWWRAGVTYKYLVIADWSSNS